MIKGYKMSPVSTQAVPPVKVQPRRFHFYIGLKSFIALTAVFCGFFAFLFLPQLAAIIFSAIHLAVALFCLIAMIAGRGWIRPFSIFTAISLVAGFFLIVTGPIHSPEVACVALNINLIVACVIGFTGAIFCGFFQRRSGVMPKPNVPYLRDWLVNPDDK